MSDNNDVDWRAATDRAWMICAIYTVGVVVSGGPSEGFALTCLGIGWAIVAFLRGSALRASQSQRQRQR